MSNDGRKKTMKLTNIFGTKHGETCRLMQIIGGELQNDFISFQFFIGG